MKRSNSQSGVVGILLLLLAVIIFIGYVVIRTIRIRQEQGVGLQNSSRTIHPD